MLDADARHRDLLFLLGLAPLALACAVGASDDGPQFTSSYPGTPPGDDDSAGDEASAGSGEGSAGDGATGQADEASASVSVSVSVGDDGSTSGASASASASMSASVSASASASDDMTSYDYTVGGPPPGGYACEAYGYMLAACYYGGDPMAAAGYTATCESYLAMFGMMGPACGMAFEDVIVCISQLSCEQLPMFGMGVCDTENAALQAACA